MCMLSSCGKDDAAGKNVQTKEAVSLVVKNLTKQQVEEEFFPADTDLSDLWSVSLSVDVCTEAELIDRDVTLPDLSVVFSELGAESYPISSEKENDVSEPEAYFYEEYWISCPHLTKEAFTDALGEQAVWFVYTAEFGIWQEACLLTDALVFEATQEAASLESE